MKKFLSLLMWSISVFACEEKPSLAEVTNAVFDFGEPYLIRVPADCAVNPGEILSDEEKSRLVVFASNDRAEKIICVKEESFTSAKLNDLLESISILSPLDPAITEISRRAYDGDREAIILTANFAELNPQKLKLLCRAQPIALATIGHHHIDQAMTISYKDQAKAYSLANLGRAYFTRFFSRLSECADHIKDDDYLDFSYAIAFSGETIPEFEKGLRHLETYAKSATGRADPTQTYSLIGAIYHHTCRRACDKGFTEFPKKLFEGTKNNKVITKADPIKLAAFNAIFSFMEENHYFTERADYPGVKFM